MLHNGIIFKLTQNSISRNLPILLRDFLKKSKTKSSSQRSISKWKNVNVGPPQGSILGPLSFLMYIYDLPEGLSTNAKAIAGDTILFSVDIATSANNHNKDLRIIQLVRTQNVLIN